MPIRVRAGLRVAPVFSRAVAARVGTIRRPIFAVFTVRGMAVTAKHADVASMSVAVGGAQRVNVAGLSVDAGLVELITQEVLPGTGVDKDAWFEAFGDIVRELGPQNKALLAKRDALQKQIDDYHKASKGPVDMVPYKAFLTKIGYLVPEGAPFKISSTKVDPEIALVAGPQLVCPIDNPRFMLNAANARWGSMMDALYGTDVIEEEGGATRGKGYNRVRGAKVFEETHKLLDEFFPLDGASYADVASFAIKDGKLVATVDGKELALKSPEKFAGYNAKGSDLSSVLLRNHGLHFDILIDREDAVGKDHKAGVKDVMVESALSAIGDCEDSVAAVDAGDKVVCYRNWLGLMKGTLGVEVKKGNSTVTRTLNPDRVYTAPDGKGEISVPGRVVLLVRNVGLHVYTDAVTTAEGDNIPENFLDCMMTATCMLHDIKGTHKYKNSRTGSGYIVRPKMHGPEEVELANELFLRTEAALGMPPNTLKMGIMDEERRTSVNLFEAMRPASARLAFINTGFLDRTGDEIHTSFEAGPFLPKDEIKKQVWIKAYEDNNVDAGFRTHLSGKGQIGKGMWAAPDNMKQMLKEKIGHPMAGANTAWVPSPTAATLHALHYHRCLVQTRQEELKSRAAAKVEDILTIPLLNRKLDPEEVQQELDNNAQGILGYVVRWVGQGVGCSKVPDMHDVQLMEDRATLRISSQHIANWLYHGVCTDTQVLETLRRMAAVVDRSCSPALALLYSWRLSVHRGCNPPACRPLRTRSRLPRVSPVSRCRSVTRGWWVVPCLQAEHRGCQLHADGSQLRRHRVSGCGGPDLQGQRDPQRPD